MCIIITPFNLDILKKIVVKVVVVVDTVDKAEKRRGCLSYLLLIRQWIKKAFFNILHSALKKKS